MGFLLFQIIRASLSLSLSLSLCLFLSPLSLSPVLSPFSSLSVCLSICLSVFFSLSPSTSLSPLSLSPSFLHSLLCLSVFPSVCFFLPLLPSPLSLFHQPLPFVSFPRPFSIPFSVCLSVFLSLYMLYPLFLSLSLSLSLILCLYLFLSPQPLHSHFFLSSAAFFHSSRAISKLFLSPNSTNSFLPLLVFLTSFYSINFPSS